MKPDDTQVNVHDKIIIDKTETESCTLIENLAQKTNTSKIRRLKQSNTLSQIYPTPHKAI